MQWRRTCGESSVGRCHEHESLDEDLEKGSLQCRLARSCALRSVATDGQGHDVAVQLGQMQPKGAAGLLLARRRVPCEVR